MSHLKNTLRPAVPAGTHPVETGRYIVPTPPIHQLLKTTKTWVDNRTPGGMIEGKQRCGKTRGLYFVSRHLPRLYDPQPPVLSFSCADYGQPREGRFFEDLLRSFGHAIWKSGKSSDKRYRLTEYLQERVEASGQPRLILFADEAQNLQPIHLQWLVDVYNELDRAGVAMTLFLVGQPELIHLRSALVESGKMQIVGRFMVHHYRFSGIRNTGDAKACLIGYDKNVEHPADSGWTYTRYHFPAAYQRGWRLSAESERLWKAFQDVHHEAALPGDIDVPMQYFARTVEYILSHFGSLDDPSPRISDNMWKEAIASSGYREAARYILDVNPLLAEDSRAEMKGGHHA